MISTLLLSSVLSLAPNFVCNGPGCDFFLGGKEFKVIELTGNISEGSAQVFANQMEDALKTNQPFIPIIISSYGGSVYAALEIIDIMLEAKKPLMTIVRGKAMSAGGLIASFGTEGMRYATENATFMIHEVSAGQEGKIFEMENDLAESQRLNKKLLEMMSTNCGQKKEYFSEIIADRSHTDWFLTAEGAKAHNLINHIGMPKIRVELQVDVKVD